MLWLIERRAVHSAPSENSSSFESLVAQGTSKMTNAVFLCSPLGRIIWVNDAFSSMTGYPLDESVGRTPAQILQGIDTDVETIADIREHTVQGLPYSGDILFYKKDGTPLWAYLEVKQILSSAGRLEAFFCTQTDITERKKYEALREVQLTKAIEAADHDSLTELLNHRAFHNDLRARSAEAAGNATRLGVLLIDLDNFRFFNEAYGHLIGDKVLRQVAETLRSAGLGFGFESIARYGGDEFALLIPNVKKDDARVRDADIERIFNFLGYRLPGYDRPVPLTVTVGIAYYPDDGDAISEVLDRADKRLMQSKEGMADSAIADEFRHRMNSNSEGFTMLDALVTAVDNKDRYTRRHSEDVLDYALLIARALGLEEQQRTVLAVAALLHDLGKIGVPDRILRKPGALTEEEFQAIKLHPQMGAVIVGAVAGFEQTLDAIMHHHERWDGKGYPSGLASYDIPLFARIMAVADGFSAMTTDRPYRSGMSSDEAISILINGSGSQWDPEIVDVLVKNWTLQAA
jgi:diguanylate cyclase (GGDEF)-like protein/PAS domain S-box-containing protein